MINPVKNFLDSFIEAGADIITIHHEINDNVIECLKKIRKKNLKAGISIKPITKSNSIKKYLDYVDLILVMTVEPGFGGQKFLDSQLKKISEIKQIIGNRDIELEVDGGITLETAKKAVKAGANVLVSGSTIFKGKDYQEKIIKLKKQF